jgi:hypothetical protein
MGRRRDGVLIVAQSILFLCLAAPSPFHREKPERRPKSFDRTKKLTRLIFQQFHGLMKQGASMG